ncbi:MAG TPA: NAD-dependent epimerase/dehydratase family protein [Chitinophagaceae bacterium]|nr:NAD-dependent epimerase/dehydratase family protein [Chitinophagaceae bacterium]
MNTRILMTGANGHLGANTVRSLLKKNYDVNAFVRSNSDLSGLKGLPVTYCFGDVRDREALMKAATGCEAIIHHAAVYKVWAKTPAEIMEPAIEGTRNIFSAAAKAGIKRIVYTSSTYAIGTTKDRNQLLTEEDWSDQDYVPYGIAKTKSEQVAWELSEKNNIPMISLCPAAIYGRYDYKITPSNRLPVDIFKGMGMTVKGALSVVDARDAGELHALALTSGRVGERYIVSGGGYEFREIGKVAGALSGKRVMYVPFGRSVNIATAGIMEMIAKLTGWTPPFTIGLAKEYSHRYARFDNSKVIKDFNYTFYSLEDTIRDTIKWFSFINKIKLNNRIIGQFAPEAEWINKAIAT